MGKDDTYLSTILRYSKLPPSKISIETFQGIVIHTILDTKIFAVNSELQPFLDGVFGIDFKEYVYKSRTLIIARVIRFMSTLKKDELHTLKVNFFEYFKKISNINDKGDLSKWLQGLGGE